MLDNFGFYIRKNKVVKQNIPIDLAHSLLNKSIKRKKYIQDQKINNDTKDFIFEDIYESLREASQALLSLEKYKSYSHEALIAFVNEKYPKIFDPGDIQDFDDFRKTRHNLVYYAQTTSIEKTKKAFKLLEKVLPKIEKIVMFSKVDNEVKSKKIKFSREESVKDDLYE